MIYAILLISCFFVGFAAGELMKRFRNGAGVGYLLLGLTAVAELFALAYLSAQIV